MDHIINEKNREEEYVFWYYILYSIGSYIIHKSEKYSESEEDNIITCLFCGYWVLYNIAMEIENMEMERDIIIE